MKINHVWPLLFSINPIWRPIRIRILNLSACITRDEPGHYNDVIMSAMASQITGVPIVCSTVCSVADQRKHHSSASLAFVRGILRWPVNSPYKGPVTWRMLPFDDVIMKWLVPWAFMTKRNFMGPHLLETNGRLIATLALPRLQNILVVRRTLLLRLYHCVGVLHAYCKTLISLTMSEYNRHVVILRPKWNCGEIINNTGINL